MNTIVKRIKEALLVLAGAAAYVLLANAPAYLYLLALESTLGREALKIFTLATLVTFLIVGMGCRRVLHKPKYDDAYTTECDDHGFDYEPQTNPRRMIG